MLQFTNYLLCETSQDISHGLDKNSVCGPGLMVVPRSRLETFLRIRIKLIWIRIRLQEFASSDPNPT